MPLTYTEGGFKKKKSKKNENSLIKFVMVTVLGVGGIGGTMQCISQCLLPE